MSEPTEPTNRHAPAGAGLAWPLVVGLVAVLGAVVAMSALGGSVADLNGTLSLILGTLGAGGGLGALVYGRQAARQTNGVLDERMAAAVARGIADHAESQQTQPAWTTPGYAAE